MNMSLMSAIQLSTSKIIYLTNTSTKDVLQYLASSLDLSPNVHVAITAPTIQRARILLQELKDFGSWTPIKSSTSTHYEFENGSTASAFPIGSDAIRGYNFTCAFVDAAAEIKTDALQKFVAAVVPALVTSSAKLIMCRGLTTFERQLDANAFVV